MQVTDNVDTDAPRAYLSQVLTTLHPEPDLRVLCVDDDEDTLSMLSTLLGLVGFDMTTAATMREGLNGIAAGRFSLYVFDNWLPGGSGVELCLAARSSGDRTPVIFYTAAGRDEERREAIEAGAQVYLVKPSDVGLLVETALRLAREGEGGGEEAARASS